MGKIILYIACSIDGRIADADGGVAFLDDFGKTGIDYGYHTFLERIGTVVMGAATYQKMLGFSYWYEGMEHIVFGSRQLHVPEGRSIRKMSGDPSSLADELRRNTKDSWLVGGAVLLQSFLEKGLVDEMIITIVPRFLGAGPCLWMEGKQVLESWNLAGVAHWNDGVVQLHYCAPASPST